MKNTFRLKFLAESLVLVLVLVIPIGVLSKPRIVAAESQSPNLSKTKAVYAISDTLLPKSGEEVLMNGIVFSGDYAFCRWVRRTRSFLDAKEPEVGYAIAINRQGKWHVLTRNQDPNAPDWNGVNALKRDGVPGNVAVKLTALYQNSRKTSP